MTKRNKNIHRLIDIATNENTSPIEVQFLLDLKAAIERKEAKNKRKPSKKYKPSSMKCVRNMYYQITGADQDPSVTNAELVGINETGTFRHDKIQEHINDMRGLGMDCDFIDVEQYIKEKGLKHLKIMSKNGFETKLLHTSLNISFMCDGIIRYKDQYYIIEIKTETSQKYIRRTAVALEHEPQACTYSMCLEIDNVFFIYENRDTTEKKVYLYTVTQDEIYDKVINKIEECNSYVDKLVVPPKPKDIDKKTCQYCNYRTTCRKDGA